MRAGVIRAECGMTRTSTILGFYDDDDGIDNDEDENVGWCLAKSGRGRGRGKQRVIITRDSHERQRSSRFSLQGEEVNLDDFSIRYIVCQSNNEEITNLMRCPTKTFDNNHVYA